MMTAAQSQALATFVTRIRDDWDHPGILAAIHKAQNLAGPAAIGRALCALAENPDVHTPALLAEKGRHWTQDGQQIGPNVSNDMTCPEHTEHIHPCPKCKAEKPPLSDRAMAELRAVAAEAKTRAPKPRFVTSKADARTREQAREDARRRADAEVGR